MTVSPHVTAALLARVSKDRSRRKKSVTQQQTENRAWCDSKPDGLSIKIGGEYQDVGSASRFATKARADWDRLLIDLDAGRWGMVVTWEPSRGSRDNTEWSKFLDICRDKGVLIGVTDHRRIYDLSNPRDWRSLAEDGVDSAYESEKTRQRIRRDQRASAEAGRPHGLVQYGYERIYSEKTRELTEQRPVKKKADIAAEIITRIAGRHPVSAIRDDLNERGIKSPSGGHWTPRTIRRIAHCPVYIGKRPVGGKRLESGRYVGAELVDAIWPAIVGEEIWYEAQQVLNDPKRITTRPGRQKWLLSHYATCAVCESPLGAKYAPRKNGPSVLCYDCTGPHHCVHVVAAVADLIVSAYVIAYLSRPDIYPELTQGSGAEAERARTEAAELRKRLDDAADAYAAGDSTLASFKRIETSLAPRIEAAEHRARQLAVPLPLREIIEPEVDIEQRWEAMPVAAKRDLLGALHFRVRVVKAAGPDGQWLKPEDRVKVTVEPK